MEISLTFENIWLAYVSFLPFFLPNTQREVLIQVKQNSVADM